MENDMKKLLDRCVKDCETGTETVWVFLIAGVGAIAGPIKVDTETGLYVVQSVAQKGPNEGHKKFFVNTYFSDKACASVQEHVESKIELASNIVPGRVQI